MASVISRTYSSRTWARPKRPVGRQQQRRHETAARRTPAYRRARGSDRAGIRRPAPCTTPSSKPPGCCRRPSPCRRCTMMMKACTPGSSPMSGDSAKIGAISAPAPPASAAPRPKASGVHALRVDADDGGGVAALADRVERLAQRGARQEPGEASSGDDRDDRGDQPVIGQDQRAERSTCPAETPAATC